VSEREREREREREGGREKLRRREREMNRKSVKEIILARPGEAGSPRIARAQARSWS
jgi:hypothetical protein